MPSRNTDAAKPASTRFFAPPLGLLLAASLLGCAVPPEEMSASSLYESTKQDRLDKASGNLNEGLRLYGIGNYEGALKSLLSASDSSLLTPQQELNARKHTAFIHCAANRINECKTEFAKALAIDKSFELSAAEAGHPIWGPAFRGIKGETESRQERKASVQAPIASSSGSSLVADGVTSYESGDYTKAIKQFSDALKEALSAEEQLKARKFMAFSYCVTNRTTLCRQEFEKLLQTKPDFDLLPSEAGHPTWGPVFRAAKNRVRPTTAPKKTS
jgi:tetratricopeptide (TPR) repeat protein